MENLDESLNSFREYMDRISDSKLDMILSAIDETGIEGPSVEEYFANITDATGTFLQEPSEIREELIELFTDSQIEGTSIYEFHGSLTEEIVISELKGVPDNDYYPDEREFCIAA